jgi:hypothetical protein
MEQRHQPHASNQNIDDAIRPSHCQVVSSKLLDGSGTSHGQLALLLSSIVPDQLGMISNDVDAVSLGENVNGMRVFDVG